MSTTPENLEKVRKLINEWGIVVIIMYLILKGYISQPDSMARAIQADPTKAYVTQAQVDLRIEERLALPLYKLDQIQASLDKLGVKLEDHRNGTNSRFHSDASPRAKTGLVQK